MMKPHLKYLWYVLRHKWFVLIAGLRVGDIPFWRLVIHDYTKFSKAEWTPYVNRFFAGNAGKEDKELDPNEFKLAWEHHWKHNPHHWEYWINKPTSMPETYIREMVADWMGAGRAITGSWDLTEWYKKTKDKQNLHPRTRGYVEMLLRQQGFGFDFDAIVQERNEAGVPIIKYPDTDILHD